MTPKNESDSAEDDSRGILDEAASSDTTAIGINGQTAQVSVALPVDEDDDLVDDAVVDGEVLSELIVDPPLDSAVAPAEDAHIGRIQDDRIGIVIEVPADDPVEKPRESPDDPVVEAVVGPDADSGPERESASDASDSADAAASAATAGETAAPAVVAAASVAAAPVAAAPRAADAESKVTSTPKRTSAPKNTSPPKKKPRPQAAAAPAPDREQTAAPDPSSESARESAPVHESARETARLPEPVSDSRTTSTEPESRGPSATSAWISATLKQDAAASATPSPTASIPAETAKSKPVTNPEEDSKPVPKPAETAIAQRPAAARADVSLTSKRLGDQLGQSTRESADLLTADRLLDPHQMTKPEPEGAWSHFLYAASGRRINIGDGKRARARKALTARISAPLVGGARFVPVLSRKGGVGKTTITALLGMALADARDDRVIAVDANPDRGTLADRIVRSHGRSVRDLVRIRDDVKGYHDVSSIVARDSTRLDVLASDADPRIAEAFSDDDYRDVANVAAHYYSLVLTDTGTGIVHSVMGATLDLADQLIIVSGLSVDEARLASETLTWLETNGFAELARRAIVVLNQSTPGSPLVRLNELEAHFTTRAKSVVRMPYDAQIAGGGAIVFANLQPETRQAARELAASLIEGLRASAA